MAVKAVNMVMSNPGKNHGLPNVSDEQDIIDFYDDLSTLVQCVPKTQCSYHGW